MQVYFANLDLTALLVEFCPLFLCNKKPQIVSHGNPLQGSYNIGGSQDSITVSALSHILMNFLTTLL